MKKGGTLFSYFQPTTPSSSTKSKGTPSSKRKQKKPVNEPVLVGGKDPVSPGMLVWAKMDGHPWWPGVVSPHPTTTELHRRRKCREIHVQFFGQPPTRGWVPLKNVELLTDETVYAHKEKGEGFHQAMQESKEAIGMVPTARLDLTVDIPSEGSDRENIEPMDVETPSGRKRPQPPVEDDSDDEIGVRKTLSGRPKRAASMSVQERGRARKKRRVRIIDSDGSEDEYQPSGSEEYSSGEEEDEASDHESIVTPVKKKKLPNKSPKTPQTPNNFKTPVKGKISTPGSAMRLNGCDTPSPRGTPSPYLNGCSPLVNGPSGPFTHEKLDWLKDDKRKDKNGRSPTDPDYNPRTIKLPVDFLKKQTPALRQWWEIKRDNFDTILMFKVGKFYELYHMDAVTGVQELGLVFMKGEFAHSGFPEIAFGRYAQTLVEKGFKVARIEQTETPAMMEQRVKKLVGPTRFDRVVKRELCSVISKGTRTLSFLDGGVSDRESAFLLAVAEKPLSSPGERTYGVCFVDTCIGKFHLGQFSDDRQCSRLRTLIAHYPPAQVLYERHGLSPQTQLVINQQLASTIRDCLAPNSEFWDANKTLKTLAEENYFTSENAEFEWPEVIKDMLAEDDTLGLTAKSSYELAISALGACVWCLQRCHIDQDLLSMENFEEYQPLDVPAKLPEAHSTSFARQHMILDDITLCNLDVLDNHGRTAGTLLERINHCATPFGKRMIKQWLCAPLCDPQAINERLDAVADLMANAASVGKARDVLKTLPDLERLIRKIRTMGSSVRSKEHPDGRAIFYEEFTYSKRKICDFIAILDGFQSAIAIIEAFSPVVEGFSSQLLKKIVTLPDKEGNFPDMSEKLQFFRTSFDPAKARKEGTIIPSKGVNPKYDDALKQISGTRSELEEYLQRQRKRLGCRQITYWGCGRNRFQLEIPESALTRHTPDDYELKSQRKGYRRYWTREIEQQLGRIVAAEEMRDAALRDTMRALFQSFSEHMKVWDSAVQCLSVLDVLMSMAIYSEGDMCRPEISTSSMPYLDIHQGRHPSIIQTYTGDNFIPNDVVVNSGESPNESMCVVVTGPNMGGKSTLMRQTGLIVILAQLGCYVPAERCRLSPVDRVFTRLGASDRIMSGESTFFVELSETATILQHSTPHSLVLLDELGRGTATYDGTAIACSVVKELAENTRCRTLFSTHYHSLVEEFAGNPHIQLGHMACMVETEGDDGDGDDCSQETITFLYKFIEGACPKSYGFNAARLAGIPCDVIQVARRKAQDFERKTELQKLFRRLMSHRQLLLPEIKQKIINYC